MKISKRDLSIVMIIVGIAAAFAVYQFYFSNTMDERAEIIKKTETLQKEYDSLMAVADQQMTMEGETRLNEEKLATLVSEFPASYKYEDGIMYLYDLEHNESLDVTFSSYTILETTITDAYSGNVSGVPKVYAFGNSTITASYLCQTYAGMKTFVNGIYNDEYPKSIESIAMTFDSTTGNISGSIIVNMYSLTDGSNAYVAPIIPTVDMKVDCIFGSITPVTEVEEPVEETPVEE